jgi:hypothetical protein
MSSTQAPDDNNNIALIAGIVGGVIGALISLVGLIAFIVARKRASRNADDSQSPNRDVSMSMKSAVFPSSNYGRITASPGYSSFLNAPPAEYDVGEIGMQL